MKVIFLDLDKTLLDEDYSAAHNMVLIEKLKEMGFIIVFNSSKTQREIEFYKLEFAVDDPYIVENGSAIIFPENNKIHNISKVNYEYIKNVLHKLSTKYGIKYYSNSTLEEIEQFTDLPEHLAVLAMTRDYTETIFNGINDELVKEISDNGLIITKGSRFYTVSGNCNKGIAVKILLAELGNPESYAVGDGENDMPMLNEVDHPFIVGNEIKHDKSTHINDADEILKYII